MKYYGQLIVLAIAGLLVGGSAFAELQAGAGKRSIVPPFPTKMGGYFDRVANFEGVSRPIHARAVVLANGETSVAVVGTDLVAVSGMLVDAARAKASAATGIPANNIMISATHSHSGPSGFAGSSLFGQEENTELTTFLVDEISGAITDAHDALQPASIGFDYGALDSITSNRQQNNDTIIDPDVGVLKIQAKDSREMIGVLANFTGHPVILGGDNLLISCEYPGVASDTVEQVLGGVAIMTQGACGDVTMKRSGPKFDEVDRLGRIVAAEIIRTCEQITPGTDETLVSHFERIQLEARELPTPDEAKTFVEEARAAHAAAEAAGKPDYIVRDLRREVSAASTTAAVAGVAAENPAVLEAATNTSYHVMQIGPMVAVGIPGEMFVEYGLEMKRRVEQDLGRPMILVGYANDYIGYIITPRAQETGGYEKAISRVAPSAGRDFTEAAMGAAREHIAPR